jgi:arylsulfatase A-like enzyme
MPKITFVFYLLCASLLFANSSEKMNVVFISLDDLSYESLGINGCEIPEITPHMDRLGQGGIRFENCHVQASNCIPSRALMMTGMYQQHNHIFSLGKEGAGNHLNRNTIPTIFRQAGYHTGIMGKNGHHSPFEPYTGFDVEYDTYGSTKYPAKVYEKTKLAIADSLKLKKPLFFNLNVYDPHVGWYGWSQKTHSAKEETENHPSRIYTPDEIPYPSHFPPLSESAKKYSNKAGQEVHIMDEVTAYYNTVKRADDSIGQLLRAFEEAGLMEKTIFVLVADHGGELTGGKTTLFHEGTHSPLFVKWPGVTKPGSINTKHMIGTIDLLPTFCEIAQQPIPHDLDGQSFLPMIQGKESKNWRSFVYMQQNDRNKSRAIQNHEYLYIVNAWHDGKTKFGSVTMGNLCWKVFEQSLANAETSKLTVAWSKNIQYRCPAELYDIKNDPACQHNLINDDGYQDVKTKMNKLMEQEALISGDKIFLDTIRNPESAEARALTVKKIVAEAKRKAESPDFTRLTFFDPMDGSTIIGNTIFEPHGEWDIWKPASAAVNLNKTKGHNDQGPSCVAFTSMPSKTARLEMSLAIDASSFKKLNLDFAFLKDSTSKKSKKSNNRKKKRSPRNESSAIVQELSPKASLKILYHDGHAWKNLKTILIKDLQTYNNLSFDAPKNGFPKSMRIALAADFANSAGTFYIDALRLTAAQDWNAITTTSPKSLKDKSTLALTQSIDASELNDIELKYNFQGTNTSAQSQLMLEIKLGKQWRSVNSHKFNYVFNADHEYAGFTKIGPKLHQHSDKLQIRLRYTGPGTIAVSDMKLKSRPSF